MTISIKLNNPYLTNRMRNYFYNKNVETMLCDYETEVSLFNLAAFVKHFHLKRITSLSFAS